MEEQHLTTAERYYQNLRKAQRRYYEANRDAICEKMMKRYRELNPEVKKRGRKKKVSAPLEKTFTE